MLRHIFAQSVANTALTSFTSLPPTLSAGAGATITLSGTGLVAGSQIELNGLPVQTEYVSPEQLEAYIYSFPSGGKQAIAVTNPAPGGGTSNALYLQVVGPSISVGGLQSAVASSATVTLAAGSMAAMYGTDLGSQIGSALPPYPTVLEGVRVEVNGIAAPLLFTSPTQINFVVPWEVAGAAQATVVVKFNGAVSNSVTVPLAQYAPGIFTLNGAGQGAVLIVGTNSIAASVGTFAGSRPVRKGEFIEIFATGLGAVSQQPHDGYPADGLAPTTATPAIFVGCASTARLCQAPNVQSSGLAPGFVGLYQVNVEIPESAAVGNKIPLQLVLGQQASNTVNIAIQ